MKHGLTLRAIPADSYDAYRYNAIFGAYKWDPQFGDNNTVARHAVLIHPDTAALLERWAEQLAHETLSMEKALIGRLSIAEELRLPKPMVKALSRISQYDPRRHVRLMRFDFHPTTNGWAISEVNSDVPGGLAEASLLPSVAARYFPGCTQSGHTADALLRAFGGKSRPGGTVAFVHATSYADDRQVMQFLGDHFEASGFHSLYAAPDHIRWEDGKAYSAIRGMEGALDGIVRFFPLEWLVNLAKQTDRAGFYHCETPSCNHPFAILTQSKRLPLIWDGLGVDIPTWKTLLPETVDPKRMPNNADDWILKPALGRVGEGITIKGTISDKERRLIEKAARKRPENWVAQRMFDSQPLSTEDCEAVHLSIGAFAVEGKFAGFYGRISAHPRIDSGARDIPILIEEVV